VVWFSEIRLCYLGVYDCIIVQHVCTAIFPNFVFVILFFPVFLPISALKAVQREWGNSVGENFSIVFLI